MHLFKKDSKKSFFSKKKKKAEILFKKSSSFMKNVDLRSKKGPMTHYSMRDQFLLEKLYHTL